MPPAGAQAPDCLAPLAGWGGETGQRRHFDHRLVRATHWPDLNRSCMAGSKSITEGEEVEEGNALSKDERRRASALRNPLRDELAPILKQGQRERSGQRRTRGAPRM